VFSDIGFKLVILSAMAGWCLLWLLFGLINRIAYRVVKGWFRKYEMKVVFIDRRSWLVRTFEIHDLAGRALVRNLKWQHVLRGPGHFKARIEK
jgi:hypothetical protein